MIQRSPSRRQSKGLKKSPSVYEIARRREEIQTSWSSEERRKRTPARPRVVKQDAKVVEAQIRFIEFLIAHNNAQIQASERVQSQIRRRRKAS